MSYTLGFVILIAFFDQFPPFCTLERYMFSDIYVEHMWVHIPYRQKCIELLIQFLKKHDFILHEKCTKTRYDDRDA